MGYLANIRENYTRARLLVSASTHNDLLALAKSNAQRLDDEIIQADSLASDLENLKKTVSNLDKQYTKDLEELEAYYKGAIIRNKKGHFKKAKWPL